MEINAAAFVLLPKPDWKCQVWAKRNQSGGVAFPQPFFYKAGLGERQEVVDVIFNLLSPV